MQNDFGIQEILQRGFPLPDEAARTQLLHRCLEELGQDDRECMPLDDEQLDLLAAAGESALSSGDESFRLRV